MASVKQASKIKLTLWAVAASLFLSGCAMGPVISAAPSENLEIVKGPPISDIVTPFDEALSCLRGCATQARVLGRRDHRPNG
jgi:hypothetical protein